MTEISGVFQICQGKMYVTRLEELFVAEMARLRYTSSENRVDTSQDLQRCAIASGGH